MTPKVSVIVPVYKAEAYLHRCVNSLLAQTFQDYEILLINDGSPDKSSEICDEYAKMDNRIRVFHKENGGVSSARQYGIDNAVGEYTIHVDPDDWVETNMLEELYKKAKDDDADMVICDFYEEHKNKQVYRKQQPSKLENQTVLRELFQQLHCSCWNKLIRLTCYKKYNISFPKNMNLWEDGYVIYSFAMNPIKIVYLSKAFYHYDNFTNENSIVRKPIRRDLDSMKFLIRFLENKLDKNIFKDELYKRKSEVKALSFRLGLPYSEFIELYKDINCRFVSENNKGVSLNRLVAISLATNAMIYSFLRIIYILHNGN